MLRELALLPYRHADSRQLGLQCLVGDDDIIESVSNFACYAVPFERHTCREVATSDLRQDSEQHCRVKHCVSSAEPHISGARWRLQPTHRASNKVVCWHRCNSTKANTVRSVPLARCCLSRQEHYPLIGVTH
jgi:hypothetical protein